MDCDNDQDERPYLVIWSCEIDGPSAEAAAVTALSMMRDEGCVATVFCVRDGSGMVTVVDAENYEPTIVTTYQEENGDGD